MKSPQNAEDKLNLSYSVNTWDSESQISFKIENKTTAAVDGWSLKINKNDVKISSSWNINVEESGDYYIITPLSWNVNIPDGQCVEFGVLAEGNVESKIDCSLF